MILVAGGWSSETLLGYSGTLRSVEVFNPRTGYSCFLSPFPDPRFSTVASGLKSCGGSFDLKDCYGFVFEFGENGTFYNTVETSGWNRSNTLLSHRVGSSGWDSSQGLVLIGGWNCRPNHPQCGNRADLTNTAEILIEDKSEYIFNITPPRV